MVAGSPRSTQGPTLARLAEMGAPFLSCPSVDIYVRHPHPCEELLLVILTDCRQVALVVAAATH